MTSEEDRKKYLLSSRERGRLLQTSLASEIASDESKYRLHYENLMTQKISPCDDPQWVMDLTNIVFGAEKKLEFLSQNLLPNFMEDIRKYLYTSCIEQAVAFEKMMEEMHKCVEMIGRSLTYSKEGLLYLQNERNVFASKALSLAKTVKHFNVNPDPEIIINQPLDYLGIICDLAWSSNIDMKTVVDKEKMNEFPLTKVKSLHPAPAPRAGADASTSEISSNEKLTAIHAAYGQQVLNAFNSDVKRVVAAAREEKQKRKTRQLMVAKMKRDAEMQKLKDVNQATAEGEMKESTSVEAEASLRRGLVRVVATPKSEGGGGEDEDEDVFGAFVVDDTEQLSSEEKEARVLILAARARAMKAEMDSEMQARNRIMKRRNRAAGMIGYSFRNFMKRKIQAQKYLKELQTAILVARRKKILCKLLVSKLYHLRKRKSSGIILYRNCLKYLRLMQLRRRTGKLLSRCLVRLFRKSRARMLSKAVYRAAALRIAVEWRRRWSDLERNLLLLQLFLIACTPFDPTAAAAMEFTNYISKSAREMWQSQQRERLKVLAHWKSFKSRQIDDEIYKHFTISQYGFKALGTSRSEDTSVHQVVRTVEATLEVYSLIAASFLRQHSTEIASAQLLQAIDTATTIRKEAANSIAPPVSAPAVSNERFKRNLKVAASQVVNNTPHYADESNLKAVPPNIPPPTAPQHLKSRSSFMSQKRQTNRKASRLRHQQSSPVPGVTVTATATDSGGREVHGETNPPPQLIAAANDDSCTALPPNRPSYARVGSWGGEFLTTFLESQGMGGDINVLPVHAPKGSLPDLLTKLGKVSSAFSDAHEIDGSAQSPAIPVSQLRNEVLLLHDQLKRHRILIETATNDGLSFNEGDSLVTSVVSGNPQSVQDIDAVLHV